MYHAPCRINCQNIIYGRWKPRQVRQHSINSPCTSIIRVHIYAACATIPRLLPLPEPHDLQLLRSTLNDIPINSNGTYTGSHNPQEPLGLLEKNTNETRNYLQKNPPCGHTQTHCKNEYFPPCRVYREYYMLVPPVKASTSEITAVHAQVWVQERQLLRFLAASPYWRLAIDKYIYRCNDATMAGARGLSPPQTVVIYKHTQR